MGSLITKRIPHDNRISSLSDVPDQDSEDSNRTEEVRVVDATKKDKSKSRSFLTFGKGKDFSSFPKTQSFQSAVNSPKYVENGKLRLEKEMLQQDFNKRAHDWDEEKKSLQEEIGRLKNQVKVLNTALPRLRSDKEKARIAEQDALERATAFEHEKDRIERRFKMYRESKEKEIQSILFEKQNLVEELRKYVSSEGTVQDLLHGGNDMPITNSMNNLLMESHSTVGSDFLKKTDSEFVETASLLSDFKTNKDIAAVLKNLITTLHHDGLGIPICSEYYVYITSTQENQALAKSFMEVCLQLLNEYELKGRTLCFSYYPLDVDIHDSAREEYLSSSSIVVIFGDVDESSDIRNLISNMLNNGKICILSSVKSGNEFVEDNRLYAVCGEDLISATFEQICSVLKMFLEKQSDRDRCDIAFLRSFPDKQEGLIDFDVQHNEMQRILQQDILKNSDQLRMDDKIEFLNNYIIQDGPQQPLLITGSHGSGKSTLLSLWAHHLQQSLENSCVLYHVVSSTWHTTTNPVHLIRRFLMYLLDQIPGSCQAPLNKEFAMQLEQACMRHENGVIIIIDGADMLKDHSEYLTWLLDPLPVHVRVVISVSSGNYPQKWFSWPWISLTMTEPNNSVLDGFPYKVELQELISSDLLSHEVLMKLMNHLFQTVTVCILKRFGSPNKLKTMLRKCLQCSGIVELYTLGFKLLFKNYDHHFVMDVLTLLLVSYDGLTIMELHQLTNHTVADIFQILYDLSYCRLVVDVCGFIQLSTLEVQEAFEASLDILSDQRNIIVYRNLILKEFTLKLRSGCASHHVLTELPWQLKLLGNNEELLTVLKFDKLLISMYEKSELTELTGYWKLLQYDTERMHGVYMNLNYHDPYAYDVLGHFMKEKGFYKLALSSYEKSLELKEQLYGGDDKKIGRSFLHLAHLFLKWKKFHTAEEYYKQAIDNSDPNEILCVKALESLAFLYMLQVKNEDSKACKKQAYLTWKTLIGDRMKDCFNKSVNQCCFIIRQHMSGRCPENELAKYCTDVGLVYFNLKAYQESCSMLEQALELLTMVLGSQNIEVANALCKVSFVYQTLNEYEKAEKHLQEAYAVYLALSPDSNEVQSTLKSLVNCLVKQNKIAEIEVLYVDTLKYQENIHGADHLFCAHTAHTLAVHLSRLQRYDDAITLYKRVLDVFTDQLGFQHEQVSEVLRNTAKLLQDQGKSNVAAQLYSLSLESNRTPDALPLI